MQPKLRDQRLYWRGSVIWAHVLGPNGRIIRRTTKCRDEAAAVAKANEFERIAADPRHAASAATALSGAVNALLADMRRRKKADATLKKATQKLGHFNRIWGTDMPLLRLHRNPQLVLDYIDRRQRETASDHTIKMELQHLGMMLKIAIHLGTFPGTLQEVMPPFFATGHKPRDRWLTHDEAAVLMQHLEPRRAAHIMYIIATGARLQESFRARRSDTNVARRLVHIHGTKTKLSDDDIPITKVNERPLAWALKHAPGKEVLFHPWGKLHRDLAAACVRAGIKKVTPNDLRRTFGKWHRLAGVEVDLVAKMLRHADDKLAQTTYAKVTGNEVGDLAAAQIHSAPTLLLPGDSDALVQAGERLVGEASGAPSDDGMSNAGRCAACGEFVGPRAADGTPAVGSNSHALLRGSGGYGAREDRQNGRAARGKDRAPSDGMPIPAEGARLPNHRALGGVETASALCTLPGDACPVRVVLPDGRAALVHRGPVLIMYRAPAKTDQNGPQPPHDPAEKSSAPDTIRTYDQRFRKALAKHGVAERESARSVGNRLAWARRRSVVGVPILYADAPPQLPRFFDRMLLAFREASRDWFLARAS